MFLALCCHVMAFLLTKDHNWLHILKEQTQAFPTVPHSTSNSSWARSNSAVYKATFHMRNITSSGFIITTFIYEDSYYKTWANGIRIWNVALYTARLLRAQEELEVEWGTVGKSFVCSLKICDQLWSFPSRYQISWTRKSDKIIGKITKYTCVVLPCNGFSAYKRP